ncbi:MAG: DNA polymerase III subunit chi [Pseudomonadales bacterium]|nr:DNA polymerase III subunit chi [Pseudomonadales bacterium]
MTRIDFYQVDSTESALLFTCRLIDKIYHAGHKIHVHTSGTDQSSELDTLIWAFRDNRFIPHACYDLDGKVDTSVAVQISHSHEPELHRDILVNLSGKVPDFFSRFERVTEVVPLDENSRTAARNNYKFYQDRGYPLAYHDLSKKNANKNGVKSKK